VAGSVGKRQRQRGAIDVLPSGALRVRVYAGVDPLTKRRHDLVEVVPPGPTAAAEAERVRTRLLNQVDERRNPRTRATVNQLLDRYLDVLDVDPSTRTGYVRKIDKHIRPQLGGVQVARLDAEILDSFFAQLRICRDHCRGRHYVDHRTGQPHDCDQRCRPHACKPYAASSIRQIHAILSGAFKRAIRWRWIAQSPLDQVERPPLPHPNPKPPTAKQAAQILGEAWKAPDFGTLVWTAMTTGARRGELCGLRWSNVDLDSGVVTLRSSITPDGGVLREKDTKTHQQRRVALDPETVEVLREHFERAAEQATALGIDLSADAFVFSLAPDGATPMVPDTITQRYGRLARRLGLDTHLHELRHYSATELIAGGVDIRTVAGRLGHGGGGATTLRVYAAWRSEADQRAAAVLGAGMPTRPRNAGRAAVTQRDSLDRGSDQPPQSGHERRGSHLGRGTGAVEV